MSGPRTVELTDELYRIGRGDGLLTFSKITPEDATLAAGNRFDVPGGAVLYAGSQIRGCFAETLARYRPTARVIEAVADEDPGFMVAGGVPQDWRLQRVVARLRLDDPLPFLDVEAPETHAYLTREMASDLIALGYDGALDFSDVANRDRRLSRAIARLAYTAVNEEALPLYSGIRYASRLKPEWECWAIFDGTAVEVTKQEAIELHNPDMRAVAEMWGLRIF